MLTYTALVLIVDNPGLNQSRLAQVMDIERPNLVNVIDELEESATTNYGIKVVKTIEIILGGGGPAMKIMYTPETNEQSGNVEILYQDWGTPWTPAELSTEQYNQLWTYCERYYPEELIEL